MTPWPERDAIGQFVKREKHADSNNRSTCRHLFALYVLSKYYQKSSPFLEKAFGMNYALSTSQTPQHQTKEYSGRMNKEHDLFWTAGGFTCPDGSNYGEIELSVILLICFKNH